MKQITPEIKAKVFALYWGQEILAYQHGDQVITSNEVDCWALGKDKTYLEVKPLSSITDEDAIEVANMLYPLAVFKSVKRKHTTITVYNRNVKFRLSIDGAYIEYHEQIGLQQMPSIMADYLRSKGYALPAFGYSVDELVEAGVFKLKEVNND